MNQFAPGVIEVKATFFPLQWIFYFMKPRIGIDGYEPEARAWDVPNIFQVAPGPHQVRVYVPYIIPSRLGDASIMVQPGPGDVVQVSWTAPWFAFSRGRMNALYYPGAAAAMPALPTTPAPIVTPAPSGAVGWYPDPSRRHELRYFDGVSWTPTVANAGTTAQDPV